MRLAMIDSDASWYILHDLVTPVAIRERWIISRFRCLGYVGACATSKQEPDSVKGELTAQTTRMRSHGILLNLKF